MEPKFSFTRPALTLKIKALMSEQLGVHAADINNDHNIYDDLGADSLDGVELCMAVEEEFEIEVSDDEAEACVTADKIVDYLFTRKEFKQLLEPGRAVCDDQCCDPDTLAVAEAHDAAVARLVTDKDPNVRRVERLVGGGDDEWPDWKQCSMLDLEIGERFRMFNPDGKRVVDESTGYKQWVVTGPTFTLPTGEHGVEATGVAEQDPVPELMPPAQAWAGDSLVNTTWVRECETRNLGTEFDCGDNVRISFTEEGNEELDAVAHSITGFVVGVRLLDLVGVLYDVAVRQGNTSLWCVLRDVPAAYLTKA